MASTKGALSSADRTNTLSNYRAETLQWISIASLWKHELSLMQTLLNDYGPQCHAGSDWQQIEHFQDLITFYDSDRTEDIHQSLELHERKLSIMIERKSPHDSSFLKEHEAVIDEAFVTDNQVKEIRSEMIDWMSEIDKS